VPYSGDLLGWTGRSASAAAFFKRSPNDAIAGRSHHFPTPGGDVFLAGGQLEGGVFKPAS